MKNNKFIILFALLTIVITMNNCTKDSEGVSKVTTYAVLTMKGSTDTVIATGTTWTDPGIIVSTGDPYTISGTVTTGTPGRYPLVYNAKNVDGFASQITRVVWVVGVTGSATSHFEGTYTGGRGTLYSRDIGDGSVTLKKTSIPGVYYCTDMFARFYEVYRGYGTDYRCPGIIRVNADSTIDNASINFPSPWAGTFIVAGTGTVNSLGKFSYRLGFTDGTSVASPFFLEWNP